MSGGDDCPAARLGVPVETKAIDEYYDVVSKELLIKNIPLSRLCSPVDISNAVLSILMNGYMTGNNIVLHGGKL